MGVGCGLMVAVELVVELVVDVIVLVSGLWSCLSLRLCLLRVVWLIEAQGAGFMKFGFP